MQLPDQRNAEIKMTAITQKAYASNYRVFLMVEVEDFLSLKTLEY